jgi:hypothetical protein
MLKSKLNCPPLQGYIKEDRESKLSIALIASPTPTEVQHPKPLPTPNKHEVFNFASDAKVQSAVETKEYSKR